MTMTILGGNTIFINLELEKKLVNYINYFLNNLKGIRVFEDRIQFSNFIKKTTDNNNVFI